MKFDAMMKIRTAGASDSARKDRTSFVLNLAPMSCWRRSNHSLTRLRMSSTSSSRNTIRFRLKSAKTTMLEASVSWGTSISKLTAVAAAARMSSAPMMTRLRRRRLCSVRRGMVLTRSGSLDPPDRPEVGLQQRLLGRARHPGHEGVLAVQRALGPDADVDDVVEVEAGRRHQLDRARFRQHALRVAEVAGGVDRAGVALEERDLVLLGDHVVREVSLDDLADEETIAPHPVVLPELDREADEGGNATLDPLVVAGSDRAEHGQCYRHLVIVQVDFQIPDAQLGAGGHCERERPQQPNEPQTSPRHTTEGHYSCGGLPRRPVQGGCPPRGGPLAWLDPGGGGGPARGARGPV